ncbi:hypothetical protein ABT270_07935 [Streptomyces sp900105245]|uniref:hypothetical protein n=1 Tax=Streptomyces sp. 900105245 TaxID=3154379 RepID=UPI00332446E4
MLTSYITMLADEPKTGKTNFAAGMSAALLNGADEFLGLPVLRPCRHIVFGLTDDGAEGELRERLHGAVPRDSLNVFPVEDTSQPGYWQGIHDDLLTLGADLFVLDNVLGALGDGEDVASSVTARNTIDKLKPISKSGIPGTWTASLGRSSTSCPWSTPFESGTSASRCSRVHWPPSTPARPTAASCSRSSER